MDINQASAAIDRFLQGYRGRGGRQPAEVRVHPSGDDLSAIKVWVNLGAGVEPDDLTAWCDEAEIAIRQGVGGLEGLTLELRADAM